MLNKINYCRNLAERMSAVVNEFDPLMSSYFDLEDYNELDRLHLEFDADDLDAMFNVLFLYSLMQKSSYENLKGIDFDLKWECGYKFNDDERKLIVDFIKCSQSVYQYSCLLIYNYERMIDKN